MPVSANKSRVHRPVPVISLLIVLVLILVTTLVFGIWQNSWLSGLFETENAQSIKTGVTDPAMSTTDSTQTGSRPDHLNKAQISDSDSAQSRFPIDTNHLLLVGVVLSSDNPGSNAIIEYQGNQNGYSVGDSVYHPQVVLTQITKEGVVIEYQKRSYTLSLQKSASRSGVSASGTENLPVDEREETASPDFDQYIAVTPVYEQGILNGLLATPKGDSSVFLQLGLMSEDIITEINGVSMTNTDGAEQASALLQTPGPLQLSIRRQGQVMTVLIDPPHDVL